MQRCFSIARVTSELAYSGHFRQVVFVNEPVLQEGWYFTRMVSNGVVLYSMRTILC